MLTITRATVAGILLVLLPAVVPRPAHAQGESADLGRLLDEEQERMRALQEAVRARILTLDRVGKVVVLAAGAGSTISTFATSSQSAAREKLEEAVRLASEAEPLGEPFPSTLRQLGDVLEHPELSGPPDRLRERYFKIFRPLEEVLLEEIRKSEAEAQRARGLAAQLSAAEMGLRQMSTNTLHSAIVMHTLVLQ